jgi:hypothetical protein
MTLRNRFGVVSALAVLGALTLAAPASAATTTHKPLRPVAAAPSPSTPGDGAPVDGAPADGATSGDPAAGSGQPTDLPTVPPNDLPSPDQGSGDGSVKSPAAESGKSSSSGGNAMWFGIGGGLLAGIGLGVGFVVLRKRKGTAATGGQ